MREQDRDALILIGSCIVIGLSLYSLTNIPEPVTVTSEVKQIDIQGEKLRLHTGCHGLEMYASPYRLEEIDLALQDKELPRPGTFDVFSSSLEKSGSEVKEVEINGYQNGTFLADIVLSNGERVDSRPSDAIALAAHTESSIKVDRSLLHNQGDFFCDHYL